MSHLIYRVSDSNPNRLTSSISVDPLTSLQIDGNFKVLNDDLALRSTIASPSFTGIPLVPTSALNTNTTQIASTAFVVAQIAADAPTKSGTTATPGSVWPISITGNANTASISGTCSGNSVTATTATTSERINSTNDDSSGSTVYPLWTANVGTSHVIKASSSKFNYVPSTGTLNLTGLIVETIRAKSGITLTDSATLTVNNGVTTFNIFNMSRQLSNTDLSGVNGANSGLKTLHGVSLFGTGDINALQSTYNVSSTTLHSTVLTPGMYTTAVGLANKTNTGTYIAGWWHVLVFRHGDLNGYGAQIAVELSTTGRTNSVSYIRTSEGITWTEWSPLGQHPVVVTGVNYSASINEHVYCTGSSGTIITLPNIPVPGDKVVVTALNEGVIIARNALNIHRLAENLTIDSSQKTVTFCYLDTANGWTIVSAL